MSAETKRLFTVEEANRMLPLVKAIVGDLVRLYTDVHERRERIARIRQSRGDTELAASYTDELEHVEAETERDIERLKEYASELHELGVELKDPVQGLIDFRAEMDGREVYLCWKLDEDEVAWWHEIDSGFGGRQPLLAGSLSGGEGGFEFGELD